MCFWGPGVGEWSGSEVSSHPPIYICKKDSLNSCASIILRNSLFHPLFCWWIVIEKTELNVLRNIYYALLCNCVITILYMLAQRWTKNGQLYRVVGNPEPNPADSWMGQSWHFCQGQVYREITDLGWGEKIMIKFRLISIWISQIYSEWSLWMGCLKNLTYP